MTLTETADRIDKHLKRFEADSTINASRFHPGRDGKRALETKPYYWPGAYRGGARVMVSYVCYQSDSSLTREEAEEYLAWLDAGHVGKHFQMGRAEVQAT